MKKVKLVFGFCICFFSAKAQDTVWLKSGKSIAGQIYSFADNIVRIRVGNDISTYKLDEIKSLRYNGPTIKMNTPVPLRNKRREVEIEAKPIKIEQ